LKVITDINEWQIVRSSKQFNNKSVGFVPTMGALHDGHLSLIKICNEQCDLTVVSIFINPTQFNNNSDLDKYPSNIGRDIQLLSDSDVEYVFAPGFDSIYPDNYKYKVTETEFSNKLCGASRPGHFDGVLTVVMRLLNIIKPSKAFFGEKDYQQYLLIKNMVSAFFINTEIIACPVIRNDDGLAYSSRNERLTEQERKLAPIFPKLLQSGLPISEIKNQLKSLGFKVDYIEEFEGRLYGAVYIGDVRLIDNFKIKINRN
jgi:pantoate--beta-alanine ligase